MDPRRAESIFARALELQAGADRAAWVAAQCGGDARLRASVEGLLDAHAEAAHFLETRGADPEPPPSGWTAPPAAGGGGGEVAARAAAYLARVSRGREAGKLSEMLSGLSPGDRREILERVQGGLRVRALRGHPEGLAGHPEPEPGMPSLPGYRLERVLGEGGLGRVYAARDEKLGRRVAVKVLHHRATPAVRRRLVNEARKAAALSDPAVVTVHSVLDDTDPPAIVMEWVEGFAIDRFAAQLSFEQKARLLREVARGLAAAHAQGLIHRDLKPENVLVGPEMRPRILDFGLALSLDEATAAGGGFAGTPLYASPEQVRGEPLTTASDVFSFGSLMFKVLTGSPPFQGGSVAEVLEAVATQAPPFLRDVALGVPEDLQAICLACLAWSPADRPTAAALVVELGRWLAGEPVRLRPRLYGDLLRQRVSEQSAELEGWAAQGIISREERDQLRVVHRQLLADEDPWIVGARRLTPAQTVLYTSTWIVVVAAALLVWLGRDDLSPAARWWIPSAATAGLLALGWLAEWRKETLASASFLAGAALSLVPTMLALLAAWGLLAGVPEGVTQGLGPTFTNRQLLAACAAAFAVSAAALVRLRLTGFAWTSTVLGAGAYGALLMEWGWLDRPWHERAAWFLPLVLAEAGALRFEARGRVNWALPLHLLALATLVGALDVMAFDGPTLAWLGWKPDPDGYATEDRLRMFSVALNGVVFLLLMFGAERSRSLDLRRGAKALEVLALLHLEGSLFANAQASRGTPGVPTDVVLYLAASGAFLVVGAWRARWRLLIGALAGLALGSYLLVDLQLVPRTRFLLGLGLGGFALAALAFTYLVRAPRSGPRGTGARAGGRAGAGTGAAVATSAEPGPTTPPGQPGAGAPGAPAKP